MLSIFLLAILVLIQIMLVTSIFKNIEVEPRDPHYRKNQILIDLAEVGFMTLVIYLLSINYLEFIGMSLEKANKWSMLLALLVIVGYFVVNFKSLVEEGFRIRKKTQEKEDISQYLAGNYQHTVSLDDRYKMGQKYPFVQDSIGKKEKYYKELYNVEQEKFEKDSGEEKLSVVFLE